MQDDARRAGHRTLVDILEHRAQHEGGRTAYRFLSSAGEEDAVLTYAELREGVASMARHVASVAAPGDRVLLLLPPGLDYVTALYACLYAGVVAVPAYPPNPRRPDGRVAGIVADCDARAALVSAALHHRIATLIESSPALAHIKWLDVETIRAIPATALVQPGGPEALAFLQYTSGSTGEPRGVMLPHSAVMHNSGVIHRASRPRVGDEVLFWVPPYHDMGLVGAILQPLYAGMPGTLMAPSTFSQRPVRWLEAMTRYGATTSGAPNFAYDLCVDRISMDERQLLDLSRWRIAINGAEPVRADTIERFSAAFAPHGFRSEAFLPCYGLAETTLFTAGRSQARAPTTIAVDRGALERRQLVATTGDTAAWLVAVGPPSEELQVAIVDPATGTRCAADAIGEIWIAGGSVAPGYWGRSEESDAVFGARLADSDAPFLRTGDLGAMHEGELVVTGRLKDLVIVGGRNFYPQDIERAAEGGHAGVRSGAVAAFSTGVLERERIVTVVEVDRHHRAANDAALIAGVRSSVADVLGVTVDDVVLIRQGTLPKTSSGKLQRRRTRELYESGAFGATREPAPSRGRRALDPRATSADRGAALRMWLREYARDQLDSRGMDERRAMSPAVARDFAEHGLFGLQTPGALGGLDLAYVDVLRVVEQLAGIDLTLATFVGGHNSLVVRPLLQHATTAVRDALVPPLARGECIGSLALTEPAAGSNPWAIESLAVPDADGWRLHGVKSWIGSAGVAGTFIVFARVPGDDGGITAFALPGDRAGLRIGEAALTMGMRGMLQNTVHLEGAHVGRDAVLGHVGGGADVARDTLLHARFGVAAMSLGAIKRSLQVAHRYASRRRVASGRLLDHPATRARLGGMAASAAALDAYLSVIAECLDAGIALADDAFIVCKTAGPELLWHAVDGAMQLLGGRGYDEINPLAQLLRDARLLRIFEGPTEPLLVHLGTRTLRDASDMRALLAEHLGAPDVARRIERAAAQAIDRLSAHGAGRAAAHQWASMLVGTAVTEGTMLAAGRVARARGTPGADLSIAYFEERFETAIARCSGAHADERAALLGQNLDEAFAWANAAVGDVEQRSNAMLDSMLRTVWSETPNNAPVSAPARVAALVSSPTLPFISAWLSEEFQLPEGAASASTSLRDHGLDSLAATRLTVALEGHLGRRVDASLLWRSATIGEFAAAVDGVRQDIAATPGGAAPSPVHEAHSAALQVAEWPEFRALQRRLAEMTAEDTWNPFFAVHQGVSGATARVNGRELLNFSSYNYLGLTGHPAVTQAAQQAAEQYGTSVSASRVASGERPIHGELESSLARFVGAEATLVFVGGHATNVSVLSHLFGPGDLVLCDALIHNSALQGAAFSGARWLTFPHNDWSACDAMLGEMRAGHRRAIVVIEGAYSADGDVPDLARFAEVKQRHGAMLMVDEAHSLGVLGATGRGIAEQAGVDPSTIDILMGTLSKSLASCGGYIGGSAALVEYLRYTAPGFVYSVGITPPNAAAATAALRVLQAEPERVVRLRENADRFRAYARNAGLNTGQSAGTGVIPVIVGDSMRAVRLSQALFERGINVQPMISPAVPNDEARLRFFISSEHTDTQLRTAVAAVVQALAVQRPLASQSHHAFEP